MLGRLCRATVVCALLLALSVRTHAQIGGWGVGPLVWVGGAHDEALQIAGGYGLHMEYGTPYAAVAGRMERFESTLMSCKDIEPCGTKGMSLSLHVLLTVSESQSRRLMIGPQVAYVRWGDMRTNISGLRSPANSFGPGFSARAELQIGKGSVAVEPFVRTAIAYRRVYYGGISVAVLARP